MGIVVFYDEKIEWGSHEDIHRYVNDWFDREQYHEYDMSWIRVGEEFQRGPQRKDFTELRWWMQDNLEGEILVAYDDRSSSGSGVNILLFFQHEEDAMAFKLRWA